MNTIMETNKQKTLQTGKIYLKKFDSDSSSHYMSGKRCDRKHTEGGIFQTIQGNITFPKGFLYF